MSLEVKKYIEYLNDKVHRRTFMNREQFISAVTDLSLNVYCVFQYSTLPIKEALMLWLHFNERDNYYPEYLKLKCGDYSSIK